MKQVIRLGQRGVNVINIETEEILGRVDAETIIFNKKLSFEYDYVFEKSVDDLDYEETTVKELKERNSKELIRFVIGLLILMLAITMLNLWTIGYF